MEKHTAIRAENEAMEELARLSRELETINLLIVHFSDKPNVIRRLGEIRARLLELKHEAMQERAWAARHI